MEEFYDEEIEKLKQIKDIGLDSMKEYYIAYVDILGYKDFFRNRKDEVILLLKAINEQMHEIVGVNCIFRYIPNINNIDFQVKKKFFSDNLLLCLEKSNSKVEQLRVLMFVRLVADIQRRCLRECGILLRGGITQGKMLFNEEFVFGDGIISVVEMEESAKYPRVTISKDLVELISQPYGVTEEQLHAYIKERVSLLVDGKGRCVNHDALDWVFSILIRVDPLINIDADGCLFVNYLYSSHYPKNKQLKGLALFLMMLQCKEIGAEKNSTCFRLPNNYYIESMKKIKEKIIESIMRHGQYDDIQSNDKGLNVFKKHFWTLEHYNNTCIAYGLDEDIIEVNKYVDSRLLPLLQ